MSTYISIVIKIHFKRLIILTTSGKYTSFSVLFKNIFYQYSMQVATSLNFYKYIINVLIEGKLDCNHAYF